MCVCLCVHPCVKESERRGVIWCRLLLSYCTFRPKAHKEENDPGSHSLCIGSQVDKEGKVEKAHAGGIGRLGEKKKFKVL